MRSISATKSCWTILREGNSGYDVVVPTGYAVTTMIRDGLLQSLDLTKIPNMENVRSGFAGS